MPDLYHQLDELQAELARVKASLSTQGKQTMSVGVRGNRNLSSD